MSSRPPKALPHQALIDQLGVSLDPELGALALTHRSFAHEAGGIPTNERLEFLGDSVLGIVVTEHVFRANPEAPEGDLAKMRAASVSQRSLAVAARAIGLGKYILLGRGERATGGADKDSILSDTLEALIGAVYVTHGMEITRAMVERLVGPALARAAQLGAGLDWKTSLQELAAQLNLAVPEYQAQGEGPDHARVFTAWAIVAGKAVGTGRGSSKKVAEQAAAADAYHRLQSNAAGADDHVASSVIRPPTGGEVG
ncbi:MAG: ribonuclease III [Bifidobacteriaceae bacterium]|nr:ribonuclease III [Bifidobacteriaceae bacterium]